MIFKIKIFGLLFSVSGCMTLPNYSLSEAEQIRNEFVRKSEAAGQKLNFTPGVKEWTRPSFISWREEQKVIAMPVYSELKESQREFLKNIAGSEDDSKKLFNLFFRWFFLPHELTHAYQGLCKNNNSHYKSEQIANDMAVAFFMSDAKYQSRLIELEDLLEKFSKNLKKTPENPAQYFDTNYQNLSKDPYLYGSFQFKFVAESLKNKKNLDFKLLVKKLCE